ncbi:MAG: hypothetical protein ABEH40_07470 [Haloferacaceae archaeon]
MRDPTAERAGDGGLAPLAPRADSLDGARIGIHLNAKPAAEPVSAVLRARLADRHPGATFDRCRVPARDDEALARIGEWAAGGIDACVAVIGDCGGCTRAVVRAADAVEAAGVPAVGVVAEAFARSFEANARDGGRALRHRAVPIRSETTDRDRIRSALDGAVLDGIEAALTTPPTGDETGTGGGASGRSPR